jgi:transcriptional regulator
MYIPKAFHVEDEAALFDFMKSHSFAIVVTNHEGTPFATHIPILIDQDNKRLIGHIARANKQSEQGNSDVLVIFNGPHAYISPSWYKENNTVPTWNYAAVHVYGKLKFIEDPHILKQILNETVNYYESGMEQPWSTDMNNEFNSGLMNAIIGFEIEITKIEGKWKLSQNHSKERQANVIEGLKAQGDKDSLEIANLMGTEL